MNLPWELGILILLPITTLQLSIPSTPSYIGAVAEYSPVRGVKDGKDAAVLNAENYIKFAKIAYQYSVDILVFPESSLSMSSSITGKYSRSGAASYIPAPEDKIIPCNDDKNKYATSLKIISCAAKDHHMYIVVNHREKVDCVKGSDGCPNDGFLIYNTNVAFDRNGQVVARYRKYNLFGERGTNRTSEPIPSTFETDFGVTFGQFICFDILFETPTLNLTRNLGITDIIFSTHWFSELPYLYGVEAQAAWAYANDVNMLASGYNNPRTASGGSGIYIGQEGYTEVISEDKASNILVISEIPKVVNGKRLLKINREKTTIYKFSISEIETSETEHSGKYLHKTDNLSLYTTELIDPRINTNNKILCDGEFCCEFKLQMEFDESLITNNNYYRYRLAVFNGTRSFDRVVNGGIQTCGIIHCINESPSSCGELIANKNLVMPTTFHNVDISLLDIKRGSTLFMPITLSTNMLPLNSTDFSFGYFDSQKTFIYNMNLLESKKDLLTLAIYGRNFALDS